MEIGRFWKYKRVKLDQNSPFFPFFFLQESFFFCGGSGEADMPPVWYNWVISPCCFSLSLYTGVTGTDTGPLLVHLLVVVAVIYPLDFCKCQWKHLLSPVSTCRPLDCLLVVVAVRVCWQSAGVCQFFFYTRYHCRKLLYFCSVTSSQTWKSIRCFEREWILKSRSFVSAAALYMEMQRGGDELFTIRSKLRSLKNWQLVSPPLPFFSCLLSNTIWLWFRL